MYVGSSSVFEEPSTWLNLVMIIVRTVFALLPVFVALKIKSKHKLPITIIGLFSIFVIGLGVVSYILLNREGVLKNISENYSKKQSRISLLLFILAIVLMFLPFETNRDKSAFQLLTDYSDGITDLSFYVSFLIVGLILVFLQQKLR